MQKIKFDFEATKERIYAPNSNVPIGAPVDRNGNIANDGNAYGIVLCKETENEKYWVKYNLVVMVAGYCDIIDAQNIWGDEYSAEAKSAMSDIVFCDDHKIGGGGGWPADLPKPSVGGYGYTDETDTVHKIDEKYLPASGGAMVVNFTVGAGGFTADKTPQEIVSAFNSGTFVYAVLMGAQTATLTAATDYGEGEFNVQFDGVAFVPGTGLSITHLAWISDDSEWNYSMGIIPLN